MTNKEAIAKIKTLYLEYDKIKRPNLPEPARTFPAYFAKSKETNGITNLIKCYIHLHGWQVERINNIPVKIDNTEIVTDVIGRVRKIGSSYYRKSTMTKGSADVSSTIFGKSVKIEVKNRHTGDKMRPDQHLYAEKIKRAGGLYFVAIDFESFVEWFDLNFNFRSDMQTITNDLIIDGVKL